MEQSNRDQEDAVAGPPVPTEAPATLALDEMTRKVKQPRGA